MPITPTDLPPMYAALTLARRGLGNTWPNPAVGCVIVKDGRVVGRGWTQAGGRPHAETEALRRAGATARGATAYVTLEPCAHHGRTPPCAEALVAAGVARVVVAIGDPDPRVSGRGLAMLRAAGITVDTEVGADEAREVAAGFLLRVTQGRPLVTLKLATSLDGRIATASGESKWITGPAARERAHLLRANHDAVLVGIGTALADDPDLGCRLPGLKAHSPVRVVADSAARLGSAEGLKLALVRTARERPTWALVRADADPARLAALAEAGVEAIPVAGAPDGHVDLAAALQALGAKGLTRLLVEGGGKLAAGLLTAGLVDRLVWFRAPVLLGGDGVPAVAGLAVSRIAEAHGFTRISLGEVGADSVETYTRAKGMASPLAPGPMASDVESGGRAG